MTGKAGVDHAFHDLMGRGINPHIIKGKKELENAAREGQVPSVAAQSKEKALLPPGRALASESFDPGLKDVFVAQVGH